MCGRKVHVGKGKGCIGEERVLCEWKGGEEIANICVCRGEEGGGSVVCVLVCKETTSAGEEKSA